ncbi:MAG: M20 family metallopeptidase [Bowdeniella nasicola]|nr:M20 family metallopeptidase [Bowdeniella nasicola]
MTYDRPHTQRPYGGFVDHIADETAQRQVHARALSSGFFGAPAAVRETIRRAVDDLHDELVAIAADLHAHPELAFAEHRSVATLTAALGNRGIASETGIGGLQTAARASVGTQAGRSVAILSEYDALPEIGHACGHNIIAVAGLGAFLALTAVVAANPEAFPGRCVWIGTPAEEGHSGKEYLARAGVFTGLDAAMMIHPYSFDTTNQVWLGRRMLTVRFHGKAAHASSQPFMGRNALDAAALTYTGLGLLRQQIPPVDRIHTIATKGGERASIIPELSELRMYVRSKYPDTLRDLSERVEAVCRGAAMMTGCAVDINWDEHPPTLPVRSNSELEARFSKAMDECGRSMLPGGVLSETIAASTDFGNISYRIPAIHPLVKIAPASVALHTTEFATAAASPPARVAIADGAYALAVTAADFLFDDALAHAVREEFDLAGGVEEVATYFAAKETS